MKKGRARKCPACILILLLLNEGRKKHLLTKDTRVKKEINLRSARRAIYPQMNRAPALIRFMVDWTTVLPDFMELWLWKLTTVYSHLEVLWQFRCRLWKRGVRRMDKHL